MEKIRQSKGQLATIVDDEEGKATSQKKRLGAWQMYGGAFADGPLPRDPTPPGLYF